MAKHLPSAPATPTVGGAHVSMRVARAIDVDARISVGGLLAVSALLSSALLGSAAIVLAAKRGRGQASTNLPGTQRPTVLLDAPSTAA
jgi:hypothetical protein